MRSEAKTDLGKYKTVLLDELSYGLGTQRTRLKEKYVWDIYRTIQG